MNVVKIIPVRRLVSVCAAALLIAAMATIAYAADVGGIQRTIQVWVNGDQTTAVLTIKDNGNYNISYKDADGNPQMLSGGGVAIDSDGDERPLTEAEIMEAVNTPTVEFLEDGTVWLYCRDQKMELTDRFENGICYAQVKDGNRTLYFTIQEDGGYTMSPHSYVAP